MKDRNAYVHYARVKMPNRFALCQTTAKATRILHTRDKRIEDTMNAILTIVGKSK